jgi:hypothetical protein
MGISIGVVPDGLEKSNLNDPFYDSIKEKPTSELIQPIAKVLEGVDVNGNTITSLDLEILETPAPPVPDDL